MIKKKQKDTIKVTANGLEELKKELQWRRDVRRKEINKVIRSAVEQGDISENDEYTLALEDSYANNAKIEELMDTIKNSEVVKNCKNTKKVCIGHTVTLKAGNGVEMVLHIVGETEANPREKRISNTSPMGSALMGKTLNEKVEINTPAGIKEYTILKVENL
jgi:transcription elongation factor GreA